MGIRIIIADDHKIIRDGLRSMIEAQEGMIVVGEADNGRAAVELCHKLAPDIIIMDISMPDLNGIEAAHRLRTDGLNVKLLALSMHSDSRYIFGMLNAGASGYLSKECAFEEVALAIRALARGYTYLSPSITGGVVEECVRSIAANEDHSPPVLTGREREVLQMLAEGKSVKEIALSLNVSGKTVETYRQHIMEKLNIHTIAGLTKYAIKEGLTSL